MQEFKFCRINIYDILFIFFSFPNIFMRVFWLIQMVTSKVFQVSDDNLLLHIFNASGDLSLHDSESDRVFAKCRHT